MSAEPVPPASAGWPGPDLRRQRLANHTVEDVLALPDDAPRMELRDAVMPFEIRPRVRDIAA